jgi:hypothetical protein
MSDIVKYIKQINKMAEEDQRLRNKIRPFGDNDSLWEEIGRCDDENTKKLKGILKKIGLPMISIVGKKASFNAWLIVQHSQDKQFMKEYLALLEENMSDIDPKNYAYLKDRVLVNEEKRQVYGTQYRIDPDKKTVKLATPIQNKKVCESFRKQHGMPSLSDQMDKMMEAYL